MGLLLHSPLLASAAAVPDHDRDKRVRSAAVGRRTVVRGQRLSAGERRVQELLVRLSFSINYLIFLLSLL